MITHPLRGFRALQLCCSRMQVPGAPGRAGAGAAPPAHGNAGIGGGSTAFLSRALARSRPPPRPKSSSASAVQAPHCRCPPAALRLAAPAVSVGLLDPRAPAAVLLFSRDPCLSRLAEPPERSCYVGGAGGDSGRSCLHEPGALSDAAGQADRLPEAWREMSEAAERRWRRRRQRRRRGHHPKQCAQEA